MRDFCKNICRIVFFVGEWFQPLLLLIIRLYWGYGFHAAGCSKFGQISSISQYFASLQIPWPEFNAYLVATVECVGGTCLILGLASRLVSIPLAITMIVALVTAHSGALGAIFNDQSQFLKEPAVTFLLASLVIFAFGPGALSLDRLIDRYFSKKRKA